MEVKWRSALDVVDLHRHACVLQQISSIHVQVARACTRQTTSTSTSQPLSRLMAADTADGVCRSAPVSPPDDEYL